MIQLLSRTRGRKEFFNDFLEFCVRLGALNDAGNSNIRRSGIHLANEKQWGAIDTGSLTFCKALIDRVGILPRIQTAVERSRIKLERHRALDEFRFFERRLVLKECVVIFPIPLLVASA